MLPTIQGPLKSWYHYSFTVPWNPVDTEGRPTGPGRYKVTLDRPDIVTYSREGEDPLTEPLVINTRTPSGFNIEIK
jgi:hypothetical protein